MPLPSPRRRFVALLLALASSLGLAADSAWARPADGARPRKPGSSQRVPVPPPPPPGEWTTQAGPRTAEPQADPADGSTAAGNEAAAGEDTGAAPAPPEPAVDRLFDDRPSGSFEPVTWMHRPSGEVVSTETYTENACNRLLADTTLPPNARAALLGGRARARMRMWRLDSARSDIEAALELDPRAAQLHLVHAEILACFGRTDDADSVLQRAFDLDPESSYTARVLGLIRFQQGSLQSAAEALALHLERAARQGTASGDATLPLLQAVAASDMQAIDGPDDPGAPWPRQIAAFLTGRIGREALLERARSPRGASPDEAACTTWFYLGQRSLALNDRERASLDLLACLRTGCTAAPEYRLAAAALIRLGILRADSLPGRLAQ